MSEIFEEAKNEYQSHIREGTLSLNPQDNRNGNYDSVLSPGKYLKMVGFTTKSMCRIPMGIMWLKVTYSTSYGSTDVSLRYLPSTY